MTSGLTTTTAKSALSRQTTSAKTHGTPETSRTIDNLHADVEEEKYLARGFAEQCAQEREYTLLEMQPARNPAWEWIALFYFTKYLIKIKSG